MGYSYYLDFICFKRLETTVSRGIIFTRKWLKSNIWS